MIVFTRVDDRLIHGQIVQGWLPKLKVEEIVIVSPPLDPLQSTLMRMSLPDEYGLKIIPAEEAVKYLKTSAKKIFLLLENLEDAVRLMNGGVELRKINIGGLHFREGREKIAANVYVTPAEKALLKTFCGKDIEIDARGVPNEMTINMKGILCR